MEFNGMRRMLSFARKCVDDYHMIEDGDKVCVGWSDVPGGPVAYGEYEVFTVTENLSLYL